MNFKVLFIIPSQRNVYGVRMTPAYPPLGVLYLGAVLEGLGIIVKVMDIDADMITIKMLLSFIKGFSPNLIGITATTPTIKEAHALAVTIKKHFAIPIALGGIHPTMNPKECTNLPAIDFVVKGEGEETMRELILEMMKDEKSFKNIKGLYCKREEEIVSGGERDLIEDLDVIPFPARHLLRNIGSYKPPDAEHLPVASIMTTRGCPGRCSYCCTKNIFGARYRMRGIDNVLAEMDEVIGRFKVREIHIADDAFNVNRQRTLRLCDAIKAKRYRVNFEFLNGLRADMIDADVLEAFKSIGIKNVGFGVESADENILRGVKKNIMPDTVERTMRLAKESGFKTWAFFMIGLPGETEETLRKNIEFAKRIDPDFAKFLIFKPFPGSEIYDEMKRQGIIDDFDFDNYGVYTPAVHHLQDLSKADLVFWQKRAFKEFYLRPSKIWDHIKRQRSLSQLKLSLRGLSFVCFNIFKGEKVENGI